MIGVSKKMLHKTYRWPKNPSGSDNSSVNDEGLAGDIV